MSTLQIIRALWNEEAENMLMQTMESDPLAGIEAIAADVKRGDSQLYCCFLENRLVLSYVIRIEQKTRGIEGVIVLAAGNVPGESLTDSVLPFVLDQLSFCDAVRIHTNRPGLVKILTARHGFHIGETVLRKIK